MKVCERIHKYLILNSKFNIFITKESKNIISKKYPSTNKKNFLITTASSEQLFNHDLDRFETNKVNFLYLGTTYGAYNFNSIIKLLQNFINVDYKFTFTIYTKDNKEHVNQLFLMNGIPKKN